jgi:hypothetical protein
MPSMPTVGMSQGELPMSAILNLLGLDDYESLVNLLNSLPHQF